MLTIKRILPDEGDGPERNNGRGSQKVRHQSNDDYSNIWILISIHDYNLRGDDDRDQLISASTTRKGIGCDDNGGGGDGHNRTAAAGGTHAHYR